MSELRTSEAGTVQFPMVKHAVEIGWTPLKPDVAKQKRGGEAGMLLRDELEAKLSEFNPWLSADAVRSIVETLDPIPATVGGNREMLMWLHGERGWCDEAETAVEVHFSKPPSTSVDTSPGCAPVYGSALLYTGSREEIGVPHGTKLRTSM